MSSQNIFGVRSRDARGENSTRCYLGLLTANLECCRFPAIVIKSTVTVEDVFDLNDKCRGHGAGQPLDGLLYQIMYAGG
jgi:hypothetical protein